MRKWMGLTVSVLMAGTYVYATDSLTEEFSYYNTFDLNGVSLTFTPDGSDNYTVSAETITELPVDVDAAGNSVILEGMPDDGSARVPIPFGGRVSYFGNYYGYCRIGSNGYVTFNEFDGDYTASLEDHYSALRISLYFHDLNPWSGGRISHVRVMNPDRFVVTYENVPRYGSTNLFCTAQCEMFLDEETIRLSWVDTDPMGTTIVGLSAQQGYDADNYVNIDFSAYLVTSDDTDGDGISDEWEELYFDTCSSCSPSGDSDLDGFNNLKEYIAGTHPKDATSYLHVNTAIMMSSSAMVLNWNAVQGRLYSVSWADSLGSTFTPVETGITYPQNSCSVTMDPDGDEGYYRLGVQMAP